MKTQSSLRPVARAIEQFEELLRQHGLKRGSPLPAEKELSERWGLSQSSVNRAAHRLIALGRLRREGYRLFAVGASADSVAGAKVYVITHKMDRLQGIVEEGAQKGVEVRECFFVGRDAVRQHLQRAIAERADGVIFRQSDAGWEWDAEVAAMDKLNIPCIVAQEAPDGLAMVAEDWRSATARLVEQLLAAGHRSIVCVGSLRRKNRSSVICTAYEETCLRLGLSQSAKQQHMLSSHTRQAIRSSLQKIRTRHPDATALIWFDVDHLRNLLMAMHDERTSIPRDLSLALVGDTLDARANQPPITSAGFDQRTLAHLTLDLMCSQIGAVRRFGKVQTRPRIRLESYLRVGGSVRDLGSVSLPEAASKPSSPSPHLWPQQREARLRAVQETWKGAHSLAAGVPSGSFHPLDLRAQANRSLLRPHGWLGHLPLKNLPAGRRRIHGVDFDIIDEHANDGRAVIVMQSSRGAQPVRSPLPGKVQLAVNRRVKAVYFLHGCGFVSEAAPFAWYDFHLGGHRTYSVPLIPLGLGSADDPCVSGANIQDWWADFPQFDAPHVRHLVLAENGDPYEYERYLYTFEWVNPEPERPLLSLDIRSNPDDPATLGLLAVTLL